MAKKGRATKSNTKAKKVAVRPSKKRRLKQNKPSKTVSGGRNKNGQFTKGNKISKGNQSWKAKTQREFTEAVLAAVTYEDIKDIITKQIEKAKEGDNFSANLVLDRCCGKPQQPIEHGGSINLAMAIHEVLSEK